MKLISLLRKGRTRQKFVIVMGAGRCGTTYLTGELNKIKGVRLYGENNNLFVDLVKIIKKLRITKSKGSLSKKDTDLNYDKAMYLNTEWYNDVSKLDELTVFLGGYIENYFGRKHRVVGFKEIRFLSKEDIGHLFFFEKTYDVFYIHLTRNVDEQSQSAWWKKNKNAKETILKINSNISEVLGDKKRYLRVDLAEISADISKVRSFIGI